MSKKRKVGSRSLKHSSAQDEEPAKTKLHIRTYEDVADSEDEFHINRDKVLLEEGPARKRQRELEEEEAYLQPSDEEVLALPEEENELDDGEDYGDDESDEDQSVRSKSQKLWKDRRGPGGGSSVQEEDEEEEEEEEEAQDWGSSKRDYYDADVIETEADALEEEAEALRLQKKQLAGMTEADYGFDETEWTSSKVDGQPVADYEGGGIVTEILPQLEITDDMSPQERTKILSVRYPEFDPLAKEFLALQPLAEEFALAARAAQAVRDDLTRNAGTAVEASAACTPFAVIQHSALNGYLATLAMYFAILTSGKKDRNGSVSAKTPAEMRDHPIMETLLQSRNLWEKVKDLHAPEPIQMQEALYTDDSLGLENPRPTVNGQARSKTKRKRKSQAQRAAEAALAEGDARREERIKRTEEDLAKLTTVTLSRTSNPTANQDVTIPVHGEDDSDFGDDSFLTVHEAAEKAKRKKSLRFYTSQITQKANKRENAGRDAGGDADLPYRERLKDRQARLNAEAAARGQKQIAQGEALGGESDEEDRAVLKELRNGESNEDYYDIIVASTTRKKQAKAAFAAAQKEAALLNGTVHEVEEIGADGKRAITYAIEKNKGLTPHRKKDVRNPRVKKRKKYEDKMKKLGSVRQIYKGGEGRGGYGGELTGIKKGLVRSIKL